MGFFIRRKKILLDDETGLSTRTRTRDEGIVLGMHRKRSIHNTKMFTGNQGGSGMSNNGNHHRKHRKVTITAMLLGIVLAVAGLASKLYLDEPFYHPQEVYVLAVPGLAIILRALRPPIGFLRVISTLIGGACLGASPVFWVADSTNPPWISLGLIFIGAAMLGASFTITVKPIKH